MNGRLTPAESFAGGDGAADASHRKQIPQVVPIQHGSIIHFCYSAAQFCCSPAVIQGGKRMSLPVRTAWLKNTM
jgi:hypothetical protein